MILHPSNALFQECRRGKIGLTTVEGMSWHWTAQESGVAGLQACASPPLCCIPFGLPHQPYPLGPAAARPHVALTGLLLYDNFSGGALEVPYGCDEHLGLLQLLDRTLVEATVPAVLAAGADPLVLSPACSELVATMRVSVQGFLSRGFPTSDVDLNVGDEEYEEHKQVWNAKR